MIRLIRKVMSPFIKKNDGAAAIEFAFIALPFFAFIFGIVQLGLVYYSNQSLDFAMRYATRFIITGQAQDPAWAPPATTSQSQKDATLAKFRQVLCSKLTGGINCNDIVLDARVMSDFSTPPPAVTFTPSGNINQANLKFEIGDSGSIVAVRAIYLMPVYADPLGAGLINAGSKKRLVVSTAVFMNEPF